MLGVHVSPDLDSVLYALTGLHDDERGWGRADESWHALETVADLGGEAWFRLGDRDLGLHLVRTQALRAGAPLSAVTARIAAALGLVPRLLPATDDPLRTWLETPAGRSRSRSGSSRAATGTRSTTSATKAPGPRRPPPASSMRSRPRS